MKQAETQLSHAAELTELRRELLHRIVENEFRRRHKQRARLPATFSDGTVTASSRETKLLPV